MNRGDCANPTQVADGCLQLEGPRNLFGEQKDLPEFMAKTRVGDPDRDEVCAGRGQIRRKGRE